MNTRTTPSLVSFEPLESRFLLSSCQIVDDHILDVGNMWRYTDVSVTTNSDGTEWGRDTTTVEKTITGKELVDGVECSVVESRTTDESGGLVDSETDYKALTSDAILLYKAVSEYLTQTVLSNKPGAELPRSVSSSKSRPYCDGEYKVSDNLDPDMPPNVDAVERSIAFQGKENIALTIDGASHTFHTIKVVIDDWRSSTSQYGATDTSDRTTMWLAPGIGIIKQVIVSQTNPADPPPHMTFTETLTLNSFHLTTMLPPTGNVDFAANIISATVPASVVGGDGTKMSMRVGISNDGDTAAPRGDMVYVDILARSDGQDDVMVASQIPVSVSGLKSGSVHAATAKFTLPSSLAAGTYSLVARITSEEDPNPDNNEAVGPSVAVALGHWELTGTFGKIPFGNDITIPANKALSATIPVMIVNGGNIAIPSGQIASVKLICHSQDTGGDIVVGRATIKSLKPGHTSKLRIRGSTRGLLAGDYEVEVSVSPGSDNGDDLIIDKDVNGDTVSVTAV